MKCIKKEKLNEFLDGELASEEEKKVKDHLKECDECAVYLEECRQLVGMVSGLSHLSAPLSLRQGIRARLKEDSPSNRGNQSSPSSAIGSRDIVNMNRFHPFFRAISGVAAALLITLMGWGVYKVSTTNKGENWVNLSRAPKSEKSLKSTSDPLKEVEDHAQSPANLRKTTRGDVETQSEPEKEDALGGNPGPKRKVAQDGRKQPQTPGEGNEKKPTQTRDLQSEKLKDEFPMGKNSSTSGYTKKELKEAAKDLKREEKKLKEKMEASKKEKDSSFSEKEERKRRKTSPGAFRQKGDSRRGDGFQGRRKNLYRKMNFAGGKIKEIEVLLLASDLHQAQKELSGILPSQNQKIFYGRHEREIEEKLKSPTSQNKKTSPRQCMLIKTTLPSFQVARVLKKLEKLNSLRYFPGTSPRREDGNYQLPSIEGKGLLALKEKNSGGGQNPPSADKSESDEQGSKKKSFLTLKIWVYQQK